MAAVLITGANEDSGVETARQLVLAGHTVWLGGGDTGGVQAAASTAGARFVRLDAGSDESVAAAAEVVRELDVLVNNAGVAAESFGSALTDVVRVLQAFLPLLERSTSPVVVNVGSRTATESKAAVAMATVEYAKAFPRMRINAVEQDAGTVTRMAQIGQDGPSGGYFSDV
ncbi:SDR family NAD(P)-dependent oxidoreductase [Lentzea sp. E54]|uniref:SDR family NAD(P)-dependent oxidoreductase n=1 Tax=Lentzea xerophila TaxID=3435883 RepID=UPI003DA6153D